MICGCESHLIDVAWDDYAYVAPALEEPKQEQMTPSQLKVARKLHADEKMAKRIRRRRRRKKLNEARRLKRAREAGQIAAEQ